MNEDMLWKALHAAKKGRERKKRMLLRYILLLILEVGVIAFAWIWAGWQLAAIVFVVMLVANLRGRSRWDESDE
jgi:hypothetical protein